MGELLHISPILASFLVVLIPFAASILQACVGKNNKSGNIALVAILISALLSITVVLPAIWNKTPVEATYSWFTIGNTTFTVGILLNNLTVLMQIIVCLIAVPVHIYSRAYMKGDPGIARYWMFLSFFCFAMLGLTVSKNLLMLYIFWELVGFASYLLIGFWYTKEAATAANKKAFIINRIGDIGFLTGIASVYSLFGTLDIPTLLNYSSEQNAVWSNSSLITLAGFGFFLGAMAKSAQFPLHIWLPDAMEGPTSVSSLIHAATMVAAGVFLTSTLFPLFNSTVLFFIILIGTITALLGGYFALIQYDIKKVLAYSTISQLGIMMVAVGIGAWDAAMFHLTTHAFFKCLLFLGAGAVIHEMASLQKTDPNLNPQDLRNMGGLKKQMPKTFWLMTIASLSLAGFPLTSGFLSKDATIIATFEWAVARGEIYVLIPLLLVLVSIFTAFYIGRLILKAFLGKIRVPQEASIQQVHEAPKTMLWPMAFLAVGCFYLCFSISPFSYHLAPILDAFSVTYSFTEIHSLHIIIPIVLTISSVICWAIGYVWYVQDKHPLRHYNGDLKIQECATISKINAIPRYLASSLILFSKWNYYFDRFIIDGSVNSVINFTLNTSKVISWFDIHIVDNIVEGIGRLTKSFAQLAIWIDKYIIDGIVNTLAKTTYYIGHLLRWVQNGRLQNYLGFALTMVLIGIIYLMLR